LQAAIGGGQVITLALRLRFFAIAAA